MTSLSLLQVGPFVSCVRSGSVCLVRVMEWMVAKMSSLALAPVGNRYYVLIVCDEGNCFRCCFFYTARSVQSLKRGDVGRLTFEKKSGAFLARGYSSLRRHTSSIYWCVMTRLTCWCVWYITRSCHWVAFNFLFAWNVSHCVALAGLLCDRSCCCHDLCRRGVQSIGWGQGNDEIVNGKIESESERGLDASLGEDGLTGAKALWSWNMKGRRCIC